MILDLDQEIISQRRNKLRMLLNKPNHKQQFNNLQHQIIKSVLEPPKRIFSYSRSIRHFQEIMSKTGLISVNQKAITLYIKQRQTNDQKFKSDHIKTTNSKFIQTDDLIIEEQNSKTDRTQWSIQESPYIRKRKFANHLNQKKICQKNQLFQHKAFEQNFSNSPQTRRSLKFYQFQNEILQQKVDSIIPFTERSPYPNNKKKLSQINYERQEKLETIFTTITHKY